MDVSNLWQVTRLDFAGCEILFQSYLHYKHLLVHVTKESFRKESKILKTIKTTLPFLITLFRLFANDMA